jgi:hypothetical protein
MKIAEVEYGRSESEPVIKVECQADRRLSPCLVTVGSDKEF